MYYVYSFIYQKRLDVLVVLHDGTIVVPSTVTVRLTGKGSEVNLMKGKFFVTTNSLSLVSYERMKCNKDRFRKTM